MLIFFFSVVLVCLVDVDEEDSSKSAARSQALVVLKETGSENLASGGFWCVAGVPLNVSTRSSTFCENSSEFDSAKSLDGARIFCGPGNERGGRSSLILSSGCLGLA